MDYRSPDHGPRITIHDSQITPLSFQLINLRSAPEAPEFTENDIDSVSGRKNEVPENKGVAGALLVFCAG
jgi:hypothetical protein